MTAPSIFYATEQHAGRPCPLCGQVITLHQLVQSDPATGEPVHHRCWENRPASEMVSPAATSAGSEQTAAASAPQASGPSVALPAQMPSAAGLVSLTLMAAIIPLLGPMIGIVLGFVWMDPGAHPVRQRDGRILLIISVVLFILQLVQIACLMSGIMRAFQEAAGSPFGLPTVP